MATRIPAQSKGCPESGSWSGAVWIRREREGRMVGSGEVGTRPRERWKFRMEDAVRRGR